MAIKNILSLNGKDRILFKLNKLKEEKAKLFDRYQSDGMGYGEYAAKNYSIENSIIRCEIEYNIELIKKHLIKMGAGNAVKLNPGEKAAYEISKHGGIVYFKYAVEHIDSNKKRRHDIGIIINDEDGNIIHEEYKFNIPANSKINRTKYYHVASHEVFAYIDDDNIIIERKEPLPAGVLKYDDVDLPQPVYDHYKKVDGKYVKVNTIRRDYEMTKTIPVVIDMDLKPLKSSDGKILCQCFGKLYSITDGKCLDTPVFEKVLDAESHEIPDLGCKYGDACKQISKIMEDNNLLIGVTKLDYDRKNSINTLVYLDTDGDIVSDLFYYMNLEGKEYLEESDEIDSMETSKDTYSNDIAMLNAIGKKHIETHNEIERLRFAEKQKQITEKENKRLKFLATTYKPKNKVD